MSARLGALSCPVFDLYVVFFHGFAEAPVFNCASEAVGTVVFRCSLVGEFTLILLVLAVF